MRYLRRGLIVLLVCVIVFFNLERLDLGQVDLVDFHSAVYVFGAVAALSALSFRTWGQAPIGVTAGTWVGLYILARLLLGDRPLLGGVYTYLSLAEVMFLAILTAACRDVVIAMHDFEDAVRNITLADVSRRVRPLESVAEDIKLELIRSRRHHRALSVIVIEPKPETVRADLHRTVEEIQRSMMGRYVIVSMARVIGEQIRRLDLVVDQHEQGRFIILCPDTGREHSQKLAERIQRTAARELGVDVAYGIAAFPSDALNFDDLVQRADMYLARGAAAVSVESSVTGIAPIEAQPAGEADLQASAEGQSAGVQPEAGEEESATAGADAGNPAAGGQA